MANQLVFPAIFRFEPGDHTILHASVDRLIAGGLVVESAGVLTRTDLPDPGIPAWLRYGATRRAR